MAVTVGSDPTKGSSDRLDEKSTQHVEVYPQNVGVENLDGEDYPNAKLSKETILACIAIAGQINAYIMTLLIPSTILPYINAELGPDPNYTWITVCWQLGASIIVSIGGRLSDIFGRRYFMMTGAIISIVGCLVGATGQSIGQMIASGALFGIGSGFQELCYACIQEMIPNKYRLVGVGLLDVSLAIAFVSPIISYAFIAYQPSVGWRAAYWYMFSWHVAAFIMLFFFYKPPDFRMKHRRDGKTKRQLLAELDYVGVFLFTAGGTLFLLGVNFGGRTYAWSHPAVIAPIVIGLACFIALGLWDCYADLKYPLLPPKLFRKVREFDMVIVVCFVGGMLYYSMNVLWPRESQLFFVPADKPILRGVYATIFSCGTWIAALITIFVCARLHHERWQLIFFMIAQTALIGSLATVGLNDKAQAIVTIVVGAAAVTPPQLISFTMLSFGLDDQNDIGVAVGLAGTFRLMGGAVATAIYTAILSSRFTEVLPSQMTDAIKSAGVPFSEQLLAGLVKAGQANTAAAYNAVKGITPALAAAAALATKLAYVQAFRLVYLVAIGFGGAAIIAAMCTTSTDRAKKNNERAVILKNEVKESEEDLSKAV